MADPIQAMFIISFFALITNIVNTFATVKFVYTPDYVEKRKMVQKVREEYRKALLANDEKQLKKLENKLNAIKKIETELMFKTFRVMPLSFGIFYLFWMLMDQWYGALGNFIYLPYYLPFVNTNMNFLSWYIFTSIAIGILFRRFFYPKL